MDKDRLLSPDRSRTADPTAYLLFVCSSVLYCIDTFFGQVSLSSISDVLARELEVSSSSIGFLGSSYFLSNLLCQLPFGVILQKYSPDSVLLVAASALTLCYLSFGFVQSFAVAVILRIVGGIFGASTWQTTVTVIGANFGNNNILVFAAVTNFSSFLVIFGAVTVQGFVYQQFGEWRSTYFVLSAIVAVNVVVIAITMWRRRRRSDLEIGGTESSETKGNALSDGGHSKLGKLRVALSNRLNWWLGCYAFAIFTISSSLFGLWLIPFLMTKLNYSRSLASLASGVGTASVGVGTLMFGYLAFRFKKRRRFLAAADVLLASILLIVYLDADHCREWVVFPVVIMTGLGVGAINILFALVREYNAANHCEESATGLVSGLMVSSGLISQYVIGLLLDHHHRGQSRDGDEHNAADFEFAFSFVIPTCIALVTLSTLFLKETNGRDLQ